jgi:hypothetical protein
MTGIHHIAVGSVFAAMLLIPVAASPAFADDDDRWEDWREAQEERREDMEERWEDEREAREEWREEQRERWEDQQEELEDRAEDYARARHHVERHYDGLYNAPYPPPYGYLEYRERGPVHPYYRPYQPYYGRYYGTRRFGFFDRGHGGTVHAGPVWVHWD